MQCEYWDCGWCYAPDGKQTNDAGGKCLKPEQCEELRRQERKDERTNKTNSR